MKHIMEFVAKHYACGQFDGFDNIDDSHGDALFTFCMQEADEAESMAAFKKMLSSAIDQLRSLRGEINDSGEQK